MARVRIVVTTKNNDNIIQECLGCIYDQDYKDFICCVADDGSTDGTLDTVRTHFPKTKIYQSEGEGPSFNRNMVLEDAEEEFILFMDSDAFIDREWIGDAVLRMEQDEKIGLIGGKVYEGRTRQIQSAGGHMHCGGICWLISCEEEDEPAQIPEAYFLHLPSSTFMMRTHVANEIGGFDGDYCYLYEDLDICWRVWLAGYKVLYYNKLVSHHLLSTTSNQEYTRGRRQFMSKRNKMITLFKNFETISLIKYLPFILGVLFLEVILLKPRKAVLLGNIYPFFHPRMIMKKRKEIERIRKVSDKEMSGLLTTDHLVVIKMCLGDVFGRK